MQNYENPQVPHEVNVSTKSPVREFFGLSTVLIISCVVLVITVYFGIRFVAPFIPFHYELALTNSVAPVLDSNKPSETEKYLQLLAESLGKHMALPDEMLLKVGVISSPEANAFATLGGRIFVTEGLLKILDSENALAMVLAHEIGHIKHRDPIVATGTGVIIMVLAGVVFGNDSVAHIASAPVFLTQLKFSRAQEYAADRAALHALTRHYGHAQGADTFFKAMLETRRKGGKPLEMLSTHPDTEKRLLVIEKYNQKAAANKLKRLPDFLIKENQLPQSP